MAVAERARRFGNAPEPRFGRLADSARRFKAVFTSRLGFPPPRNDQIALRERQSAVELDCLHGVLPASFLASAERRAREIGVSADRVLIQRGVIGEEAYLDRLASHTGVEVEDFADIDRRDFPLPDSAFPFVARHGYLPIRKNGELIYIISPRGNTTRNITEFLRRFPELGHRIRLTSQARLHEFLELQCGDSLARKAAKGLAEQSPGLSAAPTSTQRHPVASAARHLLRLTLPVIVLILAPLAVLDICSILLSVWFLLFTSLRLAGSISPRKPVVPRPRLADDQLPVYTVVAALYREASSVAPLMRYIGELDYPREKLDIKLVIELDDLGTRAAIARLGPIPHVQVIIAPDVGPRTKPKALNCALTFARGTFITVFDAEDRPDPGQLRDALDVFLTRDEDIACAQASLCIDNTSDGWLPRMFTAEYAGQFDVFLQGFSNFEMPLPLGGSSNHFRTSVLREVGGWDPYNVTEDADLGFRLARFKYRCVMFPSTTYEEAPARFGAWLRQRSRWMKGWMQTWSVHMRSPRQLWRDAGTGGFFTLNIIVGGNVLTALAHPFLLGEILVRAVMSAFDSSVTSFFAKPFIELYLATIAAGYLSTVVIGMIGLARRNLLHEAWILLLTPIYWICLSIAAWRALYQLLAEPYHWEKTEHGLARHSRMASRSSRPESMRHTKKQVRDSA